MTSFTPTLQPPDKSGLQVFDPVPLALALLLSVGVAIQLLLPAPPLDLPAESHRAAAHPSVAVISAPLPDRPVDTGAILDRPLFSPARSTGPAAPTAAETRLTLVGLATAGRRAVATVRDGSGVLRSLTPGEVDGGWTLESVGGGAVVLLRGTATRRLHMGQTADPSAAVVPAPGP